MHNAANSMLCSPKRFVSKLETIHELTREQARRKTETLVTTPYAGENRRLFDYCEAFASYHNTVFA